MRLGVIGAGAFGGALACAWGPTQSVLLWGRDAGAMAQAATTRRLPRLPDARLPDGVTPTNSAEALADCDTLVFAVPMQALAPTLAALPALRPSLAIAACKGVELGTLRGPTAILADALPGSQTAILSGPSFAADISVGKPTALVLACADPDTRKQAQTALSTATLRLYRSRDVVGVEMAGALKNVIAIACGATIGLGLGESARAALMTRGMAEITRLAIRLGAQAETLMGLSGLGDLALTCASPKSRNYALGHALGAGTPPPAATAEGVPTAEAALALAKREGLDLPITTAVHAVTTRQQTAAQAMAALLSRDLTEE